MASSKNTNLRRRLYIRQGWSGTPNYQGFISRGNEIDQNFPQIANDMVRGVAAVRSAVALKNQALLAVEWEFRPPEGLENDPEAVALCNWVKKVWGGMDRDWQACLANNLSSYMDVGFAYSEIVWSPPTEDFPYVGLKDLAPCEQSAHFRWLTTKDGRTLLGVEQTPSLLAGSETGTSIPASKLFLLTFDQQGSDFNGRGLLRSCYEDYEELTHARDQRKVAAQRWAQPIVIIETDWDKTTNGSGSVQPAQFEENIISAQESADAMIAGDQSWMTQSEGIKFTKWNTETFDPSALNTVIKSCEENIARIYLAQWLLFAGDGGSLAMAEALIKEFNKSLKNHCMYIASQVRDQLVQRLVQINFGTSIHKSKLPIFKFTIPSNEPPKV